MIHGRKIVCFFMFVPASALYPGRETEFLFRLAVTAAVDSYLIYPLAAIPDCHNILHYAYNFHLQTKFRRLE
jgi:hypothetical protein